MTASKKKAVRTRRGVEPTGRPARREVERGRRARTNSSRTFAQRAGRPRSRAARPGGATVVAPAEVAMIRRVRGIMGRWRRAVVVNHRSRFVIRPGLRCWAPAPPGRCSRSSRRAPRSCGCSRPSPWSSAPRLRRRRPPPQIVLRSAIFLIRKGAWRPPAGSAAPMRRGRAREP